MNKVKKEKLERSITRQAIAATEGFHGLFFLKPHAILSASIIPQSQLVCFDLHENRALKFENFCIYSWKYLNSPRHRHHLNKVAY